jgi:CRISPR-associated protein Cas1
MPGAEKPKIQQLPQMRDRLSFIYLERCTINREDSAVTVADQRGTVHVPAAMLGAIMLGPGTKITHRAVELLGDAGASIIWVGEQGVRYYAHGRPLTHSSRLLLAQANKVSNTRLRLAVARKMYQMRFPNEDVSELTMQQLRGREGSRIRAAYRRASADTGVLWQGRDYDSDDFFDGTPINMALSAAHACLYGIVHSVIVAMGCSPGLGFVHTGNERSFVYDIADLYKAELTIPIAFRVVSENPVDVGSATRWAVRDAIAGSKIMERIASDVRMLLLGDATEHEDCGLDQINLWDEKLGLVSSGVSYKEADADFDYESESLAPEDE